MALVAGAQGQGVGGKALELLIAHARAALGLRKLLVEVRTDNAIAVRLYSAAGFNRVGVLKNHYRDGEAHHDVLLMERLLEPRSIK